jgi:hypothetical protein
VKHLKRFVVGLLGVSLFVLVTIGILALLSVYVCALPIIIVGIILYAIYDLGKGISGD